MRAESHSLLVANQPSITLNTMKTNPKELYCAPQTEVLEVRYEGFICVSDPTQVTNPFEGFEETLW